MLDAFVIPTFIGPVAFAQIPKCGSQTLQKYCSCTVPVSKLFQFPLRIAFIREPFDRFLSAFNFMARTKYWLDGHVIKAYKQFVDLALISNDEHLMPQFDSIQGYNRIMHMGKMSDVLERLTGNPIEIKNATERDNIDTSYRKDEVMGRYSCDTDLINNIENSYGVS